MYFDQPVAIRGSIGSMKRKMDTRNCHKTTINKPFANFKS